MYFAGWLCTGDLGYYDEDGEIFLIDRLSEFLLFRSVTISPAEIEYVLATHPAVLEVAVIGIPHEVNEQHPMAIVSLVPGKTVKIANTFDNTNNTDIRFEAYILYSHRKYHIH